MTTPTKKSGTGGKSDLGRAASHEDTAAIPGETVVSTPSAPLGAVESDPPASTNGTQRIRLKDEANRLASEAGSKAREAANEGKTKAASTLSQLAQSTRDAGRQFEGTEAAPLTGYVDSAADGIENFARTLDKKTVDDIVDDVREMVRRSPAIAIGAAAFVGFAISRFAKATERATSRFRGEEAGEDDFAAPTAQADASDQPRYDA